MAVLSDYTAGTITLTNNSTAFTGAGTGWLAAGFREGDTIFQVAGQTQWTAVVATITSNTAGTLVRPWGGATGTYTYRMRYMADGARVTAQARNLIELLGNGNLQAEAAIDGTGGNWLSYFTGAATKARTAFTAKARAILSKSTNAEVQGEIGISAFVQTLLDDANAAAFWATLGAQQSTSGGENSSGYIRLPGGLIFQWGKVNSFDNAGGRLVTFPIAFPSAALASFCQLSGAYSQSTRFIGGYTDWADGGASKTQMIIYGREILGTSGVIGGPLSANINWFALGV